jgi:hypothetical protein
VRALRTPRSVRNALVYVLFNHKHHGKPGWDLDPCSSAKWFEGFAQRSPRPDPDPESSPVAQPRTWLLATGWRKLGLIEMWECPAAN